MVIKNNVLVKIIQDDNLQNLEADINSFLNSKIRVGTRYTLPTLIDIKYCANAVDNLVADIKHTVIIIYKLGENIIREESLKDIRSMHKYNNEDKGVG